jgi:hypothetical protein
MSIGRPTEDEVTAVIRRRWPDWEQQMTPEVFECFRMIVRKDYPLYAFANGELPLWHDLAGWLRYLQLKASAVYYRIEIFRCQVLKAWYTFRVMRSAGVRESQTDKRERGPFIA